MRFPRKNQETLALHGCAEVEEDGRESVQQHQQRCMLLGLQPSPGGECAAANEEEAKYKIKTCDLPAL